MLDLFPVRYLETSLERMNTDISQYQFFLPLLLQVPLVWEESLVCLRLYLSLQEFPKFEVSV